MNPRRRLCLKIPALGIMALLMAMPVWSQGYSHSRVVRLSFVEGNVNVQRPDVQGWGEAPANTPLEQGFKLSTGANSFAEIQFENGGAIRLGEQSLIDFTELALDASGARINHVDLRQGYATFHPLPSRQGESLQVGTPFGRLTAQGGAEFRVDLDQGMERVEVINGSVDEQSNMGSQTVAKDSVLVLQPGAAQPTEITQGITPDDWDQWVANREANVNMPGQGPSAGNYADDTDGTPYGWADLAQNGNWTDVQGEGYGWIPNASVGWSPYSSGEWCWYPGMGFTWIASEPWGWLPYHYGGWDFVPGTGWVWFPGSLRTWSPGQVTWYQGPNWVGWVPSRHQKRADTPCGNNCGGGVVSAETFHQGGLLTPNRMLRINPTTGTPVNTPGVNPSTTTMLPGAATALPASQMQGWQQGSYAQPQVGTGIGGGVNNSLGSQRGNASNPNSSIIYDPQQGSYINGHQVTRPIVQPAFPTSPAGVNTNTPAGTNPGWTQPVPVGGGQQSASPGQGQGVVQSYPGVYSSPRPTPSAPSSGSTGSQPAAGQQGTSHGGGWSSGGSHSSAAPSGGGGHSGPSGGGSSGGGGHH